jgi:hypothetical protein
VRLLRCSRWLDWCWCAVGRGCERPALQWWCRRVSPGPGVVPPFHSFPPFPLLPPSLVGTPLGFLSLVPCLCACLAGLSVVVAVDDVGVFLGLLVSWSGYRALVLLPRTVCLRQAWDQRDKVCTLRVPLELWCGRQLWSLLSFVHRGGVLVERVTRWVPL